MGARPWHAVREEIVDRAVDGLRASRSRTPRRCSPTSPPLVLLRAKPIRPRRADGRHAADARRVRRARRRRRAAPAIGRRGRVGDDLPGSGGPGHAPRRAARTDFSALACWPSPPAPTAPSPHAHAVHRRSPKTRVVVGGTLFEQSALLLLDAVDARDHHRRSAGPTPRCGRAQQPAVARPLAQEVRQKPTAARSNKTMRVRNQPTTTRVARSITVGKCSQLRSCDCPSSRTATSGS